MTTATNPTPPSEATRIASQEGPTSEPLPMTYEDLIKIEPRFACLDTYARMLAFRESKRKGVRCGNRVFEEGVKPCITAIIDSASSRAFPILNTAQAQLIARVHLRVLAPECRRCRCKSPISN